ncbi:MAG: hypothetical protein IJM54_05195 [Thermoguttaceae bacterium]|nr:hypothetical protein [Thermoguttaceae bacterium]
MRNRNRFFLALGVAFALCVPYAASLVNGAFFNANAPYAQDDDPFADDADDAFVETVDSEDPFGESSASDPFAPSTIPGGNAPKPEVVAPAKTDPEPAQAEGEGTDERSKYLRPEDVPDEIKTEEDFVATATAAEKAVLGRNPQNSAELFSAAAQIARVGRPLFAKVLVEKAANAPDADPASAAAILDSLGPGRATYFISLPEIGPVGAEVYNKIMETARQSWEGEAALRDAIARAGSGSTSDRAAAIVDLRRGGPAAVSLLVLDLIGSDEAKSADARALLPFFEGDCVEALIATLQGAADSAIPPVVSLLGDQKDLRVAPELLAALYDGDLDDAARQATIDALAKQYSALPTQAEFALSSYKKALAYYNRTELFPRVVAGETELWSWDADKKSPVRNTISVEQAYLEETARWARLAYRVGTAANALPVGGCELAIVSTSELELAKVGYAKAADGLVNLQGAFPEVGADELQSAICYALDAQRCQGALMPTIWLRDIGDASLVRSNDVSSAIVRAATCADRRVRFEAISAIANWNPEDAYIGASKVGRMLEWFMTSTGSRVAVVACPKLEDCSKLGLLLQQQGYKFISVTTGRDALLAAQNCADVELIVASANVSMPDARVIAQTLRADVRTSDVPLLVCTNADGEDTAANLLVGREPNAYVYPTPSDLMSSSMALQRLFDYVKPDQVAASDRLEQSKAAARTFLALSKSRPDLYEFDRMNDLIRKFLATPAFFDQGLDYAATVKTNYAQTTLVGMIGDTNLTLDQRRKALGAFERQLAANGSLLRGPDVAAMYNRYNASEKEDAETQKVLSDMLDVYEKATEK